MSGDEEHAAATVRCTELLTVLLKQDPADRGLLLRLLTETARELANSGPPELLGDRIVVLLLGALTLTAEALHVAAAATGTDAHDILRQIAQARAANPMGENP
ncbi:MAG: hypothetical protein ACRDZ1_16810 [Acidimicrobiia bacterium]